MFEMRPWQGVLATIALCAVLFLVPAGLIQLRLNQNRQQQGIIVQELKRACPGVAIKSAAVSYEGPRVYLRVSGCDDPPSKKVVLDAIRKIKRDHDLGVEIWVVFVNRSGFEKSETIKI